MEDKWLTLSSVKAKEPNQLEAEVFVPVDSLWFSGHFPGEPILPGMALISVVWQVIRRAGEEKGEAIELSRLKRVRFSQPVRPGEQISVQITVGEENGELVCPFKVINGEIVVCGGMITARKMNK